ncbi:SusC/RagA family TonB-linked outer membrane protein [Sphingobacterium pedocola]|uniref:TonB-dependent receptor plug domain-containing protein n=1 Tax=Sphingobacterium pedocola TaxID=2082722 RepID=A0ABR9T355_9SPHI|nr:SusC/RagA family TonB-linked outer membrane protein [Sphingobacterium pedocola]MBE8719778.1 hypothetical protein [Sphingobacterium pedocola]
MRKLRKGESYALLRSVIPSQFKDPSKVGMTKKKETLPCHAEDTRYLLSRLFRSSANNKFLSGVLRICILFFIVVLFSDAQAQSGRTLGGEVRSAADGQTIEGASVQTGNKYTLTDKEGRFSITAPQPKGTLKIHHIGYVAQTVAYDETTTPLEIRLEPNEQQIEEVEVVSTGYQRIPKERATGSFVQIDNELLNRRISTNLLDRLDGIVPGMQFRSSSSGGYNPSLIEIRGRNTISAGSAPLIILDDFPYQGDINAINPNDVLSISVLRDAAAASIWGARAGNGVIVIQTKKGSNKARAEVNIANNVTIGNKVDLYSANRPMLSSTEYIEVEQFLFDKGAYNTRIRNGFQGISPAVSIFQQTKDGTISLEESTLLINNLKEQDVRNDLLRFYYKHPVSYQTSVGISGSSAAHRYYIAAGNDLQNGNVVNDKRNRTTLTNNHSLLFFADRLHVDINTFYAFDRQKSGHAIASFYPYDRMQDNERNAMAWTSASGLSLSFTENVNEQLLDWRYRPLDELNLGANRTNDDRFLRVNTAVSYNLFDKVKVKLLYGYQQGESSSLLQNDLDRFYTRNLINTFSKIESGVLQYNLPQGEIWDSANTSRGTHTGRLQADYKVKFFRNDLDLFGGFEVMSDNRSVATNILYGVDAEKLTNRNTDIDFNRAYPYYYNNTTATIPNGFNQVRHTDRFVSYYVNGLYNVRDRYMLSFSLRKDESNLFGVDANQKGVPLWSVGAKWDLKREQFFNLDVVSNLKLKGTFGYTGNIDKSTSRYLTAQSASFLTNLYGQLYANVINPPNPMLRWEKIRNSNLGLEMSLWNNSINLEIERWEKSGQDLISKIDLAPQAGLASFIGNAASTASEGIDVSLHTRNMQRSRFSWDSFLLMSKSKSLVSEIFIEPGSNYNVVSSPAQNFIEGNPYWSIYSFPYKGLDEAGNPIGFLLGEESKEYPAILNSTERDGIKLHGSSIPTVFGSFRNQFTYRSWSLSFSLLYKMGYYFKRSSLNNSTAYGSGGTVDAYQTDYEGKWMTAGDEAHTDVPSLIYPANLSRSRLYIQSDRLIESGSHIYFQDVNISYDMDLSSGIKMRTYFFINNLGMIWRKNRQGIDPNALGGYPMPITYTLGLNFNI